MGIAAGDKVHIITRRQFDSDLRRHFAGVVEDTSSGVARVRGYAFVFDEWAEEFKRRPEERVRIISLTDAGLIINVLPSNTEINELLYRVNEKGQRVITDGRNFSMDISEFSVKR